MSDLTPAGSPAMVDTRLTGAASVLRASGQDEVALLLERIAPLAPWWREPYAAPWVPVIEAAVKLADRVLRDRREAAAVVAVVGGGVVGRVVRLLGQAVRHAARRPPVAVAGPRTLPVVTGCDGPGGGRAVEGRGGPGPGSRC